MAESIFSLENIKAVDQALSDLVRRKGVLVYSDQVAWFYRYNGDIYVLPPMKDMGTWEPLEQPTSDWDSLRADHLDAVVEQMAIHEAVLEAGFATEPLRHCMQELYECLYLRMLNDPIHGFTDKEWEACKEARRLLGLDG